MDTFKQSATYGRIAGAVLCLATLLKTQLQIDIGPEELQGYVDSIMVGAAGIFMLVSKIRERLRG